MSHLSLIKTKITDTKILEKTLNDLGFTYQYTNRTYLNIHVQDKYMNSFILDWNGGKYSLIADVELWNKELNIERLIDQITQQYSYNSIIETSIHEGFHNISTKIMQDGSMKITLQRWN